MQQRGKDAINTLTGVTPAMFTPEIRAQMSLPSRVVINDITLREGRQAEGTILTTDECVKIAECLVHELNVPMLQMGGYKPRDRAYMQAVAKFLHSCGKKVRTEAMTSAHQNSPRFNTAQLLETIDIIADGGFGVVICLAVSDDMLRGCAGHRGDGHLSTADLRKQEIETALKAIDYARTRGLSEVNVNFQDFLRADLDFLKEFSRAVAQAGVDTIVLDDFGGGLALPILYKEIFRAVKREVPETALGIHAHNHAGMAVATALASVEGGCEMITVGVNGYGEGTGHVSLAETVYHLEYLYGFDTGIRLDKLRPASVLIADIMNKTLPKTTPLVGDDAFVVMHDKHHQYPEYPFMFIPMKPELVGNKHRVGFSEWCGPFGLRMHAEALGETMPKEKTEPMVVALLDAMRWRKRPLTDDEFRELLHAICGMPAMVAQAS
jgi:isopropylmalate/homocitrate/citramalate synthase